MKTILFDLDGTLADTAPDLNHALNHIRNALNLEPLALEVTRPIAGNGAKALIAVGNDIQEDHDTLAIAMREHYKNNIHTEAKLYDGIEALINKINQAGLTWGIVTNRPETLTFSLLPHLNLPSPPACVVCGDTTTKAKPHPEPLIHAYTLLKTAPKHCLYIGDNIRDIQAGKAAGIETVAATYGYIEADDDPKTWKADHYIQSPTDLLKIIF